MTQRHTSHPKPLPAFAAGHSARHIHDLRGLAADGGHAIKWCQHIRNQAELGAAIIEARIRAAQPGLALGDVP